MGPSYLLGFGSRTPHEYQNPWMLKMCRRYTCKIAQYWTEICDIGGGGALKGKQDTSARDRTVKQWTDLLYAT